MALPAYAPDGYRYVSGYSGRYGAGRLEFARGWAYYLRLGLVRYYSASLMAGSHEGVATGGTRKRYQSTHTRLPMRWTRG